jgi:hypothetical protein
MPNGLISLKENEHKATREVHQSSLPRGWPTREISEADREEALLRWQLGKIPGDKRLLGHLCLRDEGFVL